jgi:hypothetical protein
MELLESQDPEKKKLIETSDRHKRALEKEVTALTEKTERMLTNALIIGGSLALTYFIVSSLSGGKKKKRKVKAAKVQAALEDAEGEVEVEEEEDNGPSVISQIGTRVLNQATVMLLDIAKEQLAEYLESRKKDNENS